MTQPAFTPMQTALVALLPKRSGAVSAAELASAARISMPTVHAELRPLIEAGAVAYDGTLDQYVYAGSQS